MRALAVIAMLATSCGGDGGGRHVTLHVSPGGHTFAIHAAVTATPDLVGPWLDERVAEWVASHPERDSLQLTLIALRQRYICIDSAAYYYPAYRGYVAGFQEWPATIGACIYGYRKADTEAEALALTDAAHTVFPWHEGGWIYGVLVTPLPAVGHELDHVIGIHHARTLRGSAPPPAGGSPSLPCLMTDLQESPR